MENVPKHAMNLICRKDDNWKLSRGAYAFILIGLLLLLGAIAAIIVIIKPWTVIKCEYGICLLLFWF